MLGLTRKLKYFIITSLLILATLFVYGEPVYPEDTVVFYGNGVLADEDSASASLRALKNRMLSDNEGSSYEALLTFKHAYNRTHELTHGLLDLAEAFIQYF